MSATAGQADGVRSLADRLGIESGMVVMEIGHDDDVDGDLRDMLLERVGEFVDEDTDEVVDTVLLWWREGDGDLVETLIDALSPLAENGVVWLLSGIKLLLLVLAATTVSFHVRVDGDGLTVRSVMGLPRFRVALAEIASVGTVQVDPMGEFGGWRIPLGADRRFGIRLRAGDAIEVARPTGRRLVVTVDDAETGAGLLQALAARRAAARP